jgi:hypothetical protein
VATRVKRFAVAVVLLLIAVVAAGMYYASRVLAIGIAYKAKSVCAGVFVSKRPLSEVLDDVESDDLVSLRRVTTTVDAGSRSVTASVSRFVPRRAVYREGRGCTLVFNVREFPPPTDVAGAASTSPGDVWSNTPGDVAAAAATRAKLDPVVERAFTETNPNRPQRTRAIAILHHGRPVAERYATGISAETPLAGWSMAKSVLHALVGVLVKEGRLSIDTAGLVAEWRQGGDPHAACGS